MDWLINWCLTPNLAVFQIYRGVQKLDIFMCDNNIIIKMVYDV
jgi:stringent starvation protein B